MKPQLRNLFDACDKDFLLTAHAYEKALDGKQSIVDTAYLAILRGGSDMDALEAVLRAHKGAKTKLNQISQYRGAMRNQMGIPVETQGEVTRRQREERIAACTA